MSQFATSAGFFADSVSDREERGDIPRLVFRRDPAVWSAESFAREQLQGLMQKLFFSGPNKNVKHVLFSPIDRETHIESIARLLGQALALEKLGSVAVMAGLPHQMSTLETATRKQRVSDAAPLRQTGLQLEENLWLVPEAIEGRVSMTPKLHARICNLRREFDYSIIVGPPADSHEVLAIAAIADGLVLALSAGHTRRATARNVVRFLESANIRILGAVLTDRVFPIPAKIYRRL